MEEIEKAFRYAINKNLSCWAYAIVIIVFGVNILIAFGINEVTSLVIGLCMSIITYVLARIHISSDEYLSEKMKKAMIAPNQFELFSITIGDELIKTSAKRYFCSLTQFYAFITDSWIVYAGRDGCFVSSVNEIESISYALMRSGRIKLKFKFSNNRTFCATNNPEWFVKFDLQRWFQGEYHR